MSAGIINNFFLNYDFIQKLKPPIGDTGKYDKKNVAPIKNGLMLIK